MNTALPIANGEPSTAIATQHFPTPGFKSTAIGLVANKTLTAEQWEYAGDVIGHFDQRHSWNVGTWVLLGENGGYLERGKLEEACERFVIAYSTASRAVQVCRALEQSRRRRVLSFGHHQEVANRADADELLDWCELTGASVQDLRAEKRRRSYLCGPTPELPPGKHNLIYADPPWRYEHCKTDSRKIENQYPTMELEAICELDIEQCAADDCVLFLWVTSPKLSEAMQVVDSWGFSYRTCMVWRKDQIGMGYYARQQHELLLICARGEPGVPEPGVRPCSVIDAPREQHSKKPDVFYDIIETMYPNATKVELFARQPHKGWNSWGNEAETEAAA